MHAINFTAEQLKELIEALKEHKDLLMMHKQYSNLLIVNSLLRLIDSARMENSNADR
jgi:hypothetical protein